MTDRHHHPDDELLAALGEQYDAGFYEPWTPKVGDRVVVKLSGECPFWVHHTDVTPREYENGAAATVSRLVPLELNQGHGYEVRFDEPHPHPPGERWPRLLGSTYAAAELVPIADDDTRPSAAREEGE